MRAALFIIAGLLTGCAGPLRFVDRSTIWYEGDDAPVEKPKENGLEVHWSAVRDIIFKPIDRLCALEYRREADDVNALDEVPTSSWYADPRRDPKAPARRPRTLTRKELERGATRDGDSPVPPYVVEKGKTIGATLGFILRDSRGVKYLVKLDPPGRPLFATSTEVVVSRLAWASGWRVPSELMFSFRRDELTLSKKATSRNQFLEKVPFTAADLAALLDQSPQDMDGTITALASRWLPGDEVGPFAWSGRREDDPNDKIPHEHRRSLRAFGVFASWVNDIDTLDNNTLDMYEGEPGRGHVVHYQQDLGGAFGVWAFTPAPYWMGHEGYFNPKTILASLFTFGIATRRYADEQARAKHEARVRTSPELGGFTDDDFNPKRFNPVVQNPAFDRMTRRDRYWGAKRIAAFSADEVRGAIDAGLYRPEVAERLFAILWARRERILRLFLGESSALDYFRIENSRLCFDDVWLLAGLGGTAAVRAFEAERELPVETTSESTGCAILPRRGGYRVITLDVKRPDRPEPHPPVRVHITGRGIIGIER
jgi:hypothetical protein